MIGSVWGLLLVGALLASSAMALMWLLQVRIRDASHVDVAWAVLIACCAIVYALLADGDIGHRVLAAALASLWGFRLGGYLLFNRVLGKEEDGRYQELRRRWAPNANRNFFVFFQAQALFVVFFSLPFAFIALERIERPRRPRWAGIAVWAIGNAGTILSDYQLAQWRKNPAEQGKDRARRPVGLVTPPELFLRVGELVRGRTRRERDAVGLDRLARAGRSPLPPVQGHGHPRDRGASAALPRRLRRVPADDERFRAAATAPRVASSGQRDRLAPSLPPLQPRAGRGPVPEIG